MPTASPTAFSPNKRASSRMAFNRSKPASTLPLASLRRISSNQATSFPNQTPFSLSRLRSTTRIHMATPSRTSSQITTLSPKLKMQFHPLLLRALTTLGPSNSSQKPSNPLPPARTIHLLHLSIVLPPRLSSLGPPLSHRLLSSVLRPAFSPRRRHLIQSRHSRPLLNNNNNNNNNSLHGKKNQRTCNASTTYSQLAKEWTPLVIQGNFEYPRSTQLRATSSTARAMASIRFTPHKRAIIHSLANSLQERHDQTRTAPSKVRRKGSSRIDSRRRRRGPQVGSAEALDRQAIIRSERSNISRVGRRQVEA